MLFAVALICAMGTVGYNAYADANMTAQERLILKNIEALTSGETPGGGGSSYEYPNAYPYSKRCNVETSTRRRCKVTVITCQGSGHGCNSSKCSTHKD